MNKDNRNKLILCVIGIFILAIFLWKFVGIYIMMYFNNKSDIVSEIKKSEMNKYINSYKLNGFDDSAITIKAKDSFDKLDNDTKLKYVSDLENAIDGAILGNMVKYDKRDESDIDQLTDSEQVIINSKAGEYVYNYEGLKTPDGQQLKVQETAISDTTSSTDTNSVTSTSSDINVSSMRLDGNPKEGKTYSLSSDMYMATSSSAEDTLISYVNNKNQDGINQMILDRDLYILSTGTKIYVTHVGWLTENIEVASGGSQGAKGVVPFDVLQKSCN